MARHNYFSNPPGKTPAASQDLDMYLIKWFIKSCLTNNMSVSYDRRTTLLKSSGGFRIVRPLDGNSSIDVRDTNVERAIDLFVAQNCLETGFDIDRYLFYISTDATGPAISWRTLKSQTKLNLFITNAGPATLVSISHTENNVPIDYDKLDPEVARVFDGITSITRTDSGD